MPVRSIVVKGNLRTVCINKNKKKKLTNKAVSEIISHKNIKNKTKHYALAQIQKN